MISIVSIGWAVIHFDRANWTWSSALRIPDYLLYYNAGGGDYGVKWIYKDYISYLFYPLTLLSLTTGYLIWSTLQTISFMVLTHYLFKVKYGWITIIITLPAYKVLLQDGNVDIILSALYICPAMALLGILVKPHHVIFPLIHAVRRGIAQSKGT